MPFNTKDMAVTDAITNAFESVGGVCVQTADLMDSVNYNKRRLALRVHVKIPFYHRTDVIGMFRQLGNLAYPTDDIPRLILGLPNPWVVQIHSNSITAMRDELPPRVIKCLTPTLAVILGEDAVAPLTESLTEHYLQRG